MMRLATVGTSIITDHFIGALKQIPFYTLSAVYSRSLEQGRPFADKHEVSRVITSWEELLATPDIDVVYVASPNDLHFSQSVALLKAGKHVICEKPYVSNSREFKEMMKIVKETKRFCFDAVMPLHMPNLKVVQKHLKDCGPIHLMNSTMVQYSSRYDALKQGLNPNIFDPAHSGGALMDLGVYPVTLAVALFGQPVSVNYSATKHENGIDVSGMLLLEYPELWVNCVIGKNSVGLNSTLISGEKGSIEIPMQASKVSEVILSAGLSKTNLSVEQNANAMFHELNDFAEVLEQNDWTRYLEWMEVTEKVISVLDEARLDIGLRFPADHA